MSFEFSSLCVFAYEVAIGTHLVCVLSCSVVSDSLRPHGLLLARLLCSWDSLGKNTGLVCHFLLQRFTPSERKMERITPSLFISGVLLGREVRYQTYSFKRILT